MDNVSRLKATLATLFIERSHVLYIRTSNPIHAWRVYAYARAGGVPIPEWVLTYLDGCTKVLTAPKGPSSPKAIANAFGLGAKGGPSKARQAEVDARDFMIASRIVQLKDDDQKRTSLDVQTQVADEYRLSIDRVKDVYYKLIRPRKRPPV